MDTSKVRIPKKIENDGLVNAVVNIHFKTNYNGAYIDLKLNEFLVSKSGDWQKIDAPNAGKVVGGVTVPVCFYANQLYKIQLVDSELAFNFTTSYPGWDDYCDLIKRVCEVLKDDIVIVDIRVNYISVFNNLKIFDFIDGTIKLNNLPQFYGTQYNFRCQVQNEKKYVATAELSLTNEDPIPNSFTDGKQDTQSIVNISVFGNSNEDYIDFLNFLHETERDLFYRIVNQEFVDSHKPTY